MGIAEIFRCRLAMWLDALKDHIDALAERVSPGWEVWERFDARERKRGAYDWMDQ
jgi:hypothetical protein